MRQKLLIAVLSLVGVVALFALTGSATAASRTAAVRSHALPACPEGTTNAAYCECPPGSTLEAEYCTVKPGIVVGKPTLPSKGADAVWSNGRLRLQFLLQKGQNAPDLKSVKVVLPVGVTWIASRFRTNGVAVGAYSIKVSGRALTAIFFSPIAKLNFRFDTGSMRESAAFKRQVGAHKLTVLRFDLVIENANRQFTTLREVLRIHR